VLTGPNTYYGGTTINGGTLEVTNGAIGAYGNSSGDIIVGDVRGDDGTFAITGSGSANSANGYIGNGPAAPARCTSKAATMSTLPGSLRTTCTWATKGPARSTSATAAMFEQLRFDRRSAQQHRGGDG